MNTSQKKEGAGGSLIGIPHQNNILSKIIISALYRFNIYLAKVDNIIGKESIKKQ